MASTTDITEAAEVPTSPESPSGRHSPSRKDTIISLVQMLLQESENAARGEFVKTQTPSFEDDRDVPSVDEYLQDAGAAAFNRFSRSLDALDKELRNFANAARQLGSSVAILSSGFRLRERLAQLRILYRENAADLFPRKVSHVSRDLNTIPQPPGARRKKTKRRWGKAAHLLVPRPTVSDNLDPEDFPDHLEALAKDVKTFLNCLNEFPEFTDEGVNQSILSFEGDLMYWSSCLREYTGQFRYPAVQRYIHDLSQEMKDHVDNITSSLCMFIEVGVPTIRFAQKHGSTNLLNLSTIATFFSAVTATTMQFSYELDPKEALAAVVNCFWFASLVFSIAAAVNSLLGLTWKQAMYRSPGHRVPWWVLIWIKRSPLVFLVLSVACFSVGLCVFTYASKQAHITSTLTTVLTAFTSFGLAAVSAWFASERWAFSRHRGQKWLSDVLTETAGEFIRHPGVSWIYKLSKFLARSIVRFNRLCLQAFSCVADLWCFHRRSDDDNDDVEAATGSAQSSGGDEPNEKYASKLPAEDGKARRSSATLHDELPATKTTSQGPLSPPFSPRSPPPPPVNSPMSPGFQSMDELGEPAESIAQKALPEVPTTAPPPSNGKLLWKNALRTVKMHSNITASSATPFGIGAPRPTPIRKDTASSSTAGGQGDPRDRAKRSATLLSVPEPVMTARSRLSALKPSVMGLETTQELPAHNALVKHIQFSPDGKYLATSSWDRTSVIFEVGDPFKTHTVLAHTQGFVQQVAWSPLGNILLTKLARGIKVWTAEDGVCQKTINRKRNVETVTWMPDGEAFLSVEESTVTKLGLRGEVLDQYEFGRVKLQDVAVMPDSSRIIGVGHLMESPTGLQPSKSRVEKRLVVYNIGTKEVESQTPLLNDVRDITIARTRNHLMALVSYENKASPQLWKIELVKDRENNATVARLTLRHTYMPKKPANFSGPSYFGGKNNELVLCTTKGGDIHIWDRESATPVHAIRATKVHGGDLTCIAWNPAAEDPYMFATGSHDGGVRVWTRPPDEQDPTHTADFALPRLRTFQNYQWGMGPRSASPVSVDEDNNSVHSTHGSIGMIDRDSDQERYREPRRSRPPKRTDSFSSSDSSLKLRVN
ncbi:hypothetical protein DFP72DRAFT_1020164 [Ephemerocybe angulata]|uniref:WD40 repeat-like protein n=1 Tax=Ephemerocybe angulata TaxID=980116 RepID=A0A8H6LWV2_9AGAR|nr:hypothetical protein DFP72DRAFT_1020164 [Tulosesus angulatus]